AWAQVRRHPLGFCRSGRIARGVAGTPSPDTPEVLLRVGARSGNKAAIERFVKELAPLGLNGPPTVCGLHSGRPKVEEGVAYWPPLIPKSAVQPSIDIQTV